MYIDLFIYIYIYIYIYKLNYTFIKPYKYHKKSTIYTAKFPKNNHNISSPLLSYPKS